MPRENYEDVEEEKPKGLSSSSVTLLEISTFYAIENKIMKIRYGVIDKKDEIEGYINPLSPPLKIPIHPYGVDINANITKSRESFNPSWFEEMVKPHGAWDYKRRDRAYEDFGNFNYGATALAFGFQKKWALEAAGIVQIYQHKARPDFKHEEYVKSVVDFQEVFEGPPYGDEKHDQEMIKLGFRYYEDVYLPTYGWKLTTKEDIFKAAQQATEAAFPLSTYVAKRLRQLAD